MEPQARDRAPGKFKNKPAHVLEGFKLARLTGLQGQLLGPPGYGV